MENKLQELTNKLYQEGLTRGREEADAIIAKAKEEAQAIVKEAKKEATWMVDRAEQEAAEHKEQVESEIKMASRHTISVLKKKIQDLVVFKSLEGPTKKAMEDDAFVKDLIITLVKSFNPEDAGAMDLDVILPQSRKESFTEFLKSRISEMFNKNVHVTFSADMENGFVIGPAGGGYQIRFSDKDFMALFNKYVSPGTQSLLYDE
ncbi:MAG TPA: V-type ATP synthase subunit E family protein [Bacteroidales bacterium]|nr:hypothetical protein [Bacteroidales bacterium]OQB69239.1 MAG: V-type ATP synthase subunit E [Bacteroidetes bacterium ADurb.Bin139]HOG25676.1 V-type ATP synthase subunit E family protein [Bacteroidales bacterium]HOR12252.1 V-type ATP synthase subunit E family protein [Bacteroidales bacterium]HPK39282.1 V-type ATP synthase subunit E family protein [Bacteroidales bacterium]